MNNRYAGKALVWTVFGLLLGCSSVLIAIALTWSNPAQPGWLGSALIYIVLAVAACLTVAGITFSLTSSSICHGIASALDKAANGDCPAGAELLHGSDKRLRESFNRLSNTIECRCRQDSENEQEVLKLRKRSEGLEEMLIHANADLSHKELMLREINTELATANNAKTEFISGMGRELRLPLNTIIGLADFINTGKLGPVNSKQREYLEKVGTRAGNMLDIVNHVLEYTRLDAGEQLEYTSIALPEIADELSGSLISYSDTKQVALSFDIPDDSIKADPAKLRFILHDLMHNAVKFNNPGGHASLSVRAVEWADVLDMLESADIENVEKSDGKAGKFFEFTIKDNGIGMDHATLRGAFRPFSHDNTNGGGNRGGAGLSLFLAKKFVELHGGWIWAQSAPGSGTTLAFVLPASPDDKWMSAGPRMRKILVVDDDPAQLDIMSRFLNDESYVIYRASDGAEALEMADEVSPDLILLDVMMPKMDGIRVCATLKQHERFARFRHVPVVMATSLTDIEKKVEAIQAGADDVLIKPVDRKLLRERIRSLLETKDEFEEILASYRNAEKNATLDALTGLYNRRYMEEIMTREFMNSRRHGRDLSVLMMDLDHFKRYNDTHGHQAGDSLLKGVAKIFRNTVREVDVVARYGGEEFLAILPETPPELAAMVAERIRVTVESGTGVTISIGIATYPGDATDISELINNADTALYAAKGAGRNRAVKFSDTFGLKYGA